MFMRERKSGSRAEKKKVPFSTLLFTGFQREKHAEKKGNSLFLKAAWKEKKKKMMEKNMQKKKSRYLTGFVLRAKV